MGIRNTKSKTAVQATPRGHGIDRKAVAQRSWQTLSMLAAMSHPVVCRAHHGSDGGATANMGVAWVSGIVHPALDPTYLVLVAVTCIGGARAGHKTGTGVGLVCGLVLGAVALTGGSSTGTASAMFAVALTLACALALFRASGSLRFVGATLAGLVAGQTIGADVSMMQAGPVLAYLTGAAFAVALFLFGASILMQRLGNRRFFDQSSGGWLSGSLPSARPAPCAAEITASMGGTSARTGNNPKATQG